MSNMNRYYHIILYEKIYFRSLDISGIYFSKCSKLSLIGMDTSKN